MEGNLFEKIPGDLPEELFETLTHSDKVKIERIVSHGHRTPEGEWYDQSWSEWVVLLSGSARLTLDGQSQSVELNPGDYLLLPAGLRHRVEWTDPDKDSIWLAVHF